MMTEYVTLEQAAVAFATQSVFSTSDCLDALLCAIQKGWITPSDVAPVRHGQWIEYQVPPIICCSNCDWATDVKEKNFNYCPNCGAKMDLEEG